MQRRVTAIVLLVAALAWAGELSAQAKKGGGKKGMDADWGYGGAQPVAMPELGGGEVKVPWGEFSKMLKAWIEAQAGGAQKPPLDYAVHSAAYTCAAGEKEAQVSAKFEVVVYAKGVTVVPLLGGEFSAESVAFKGAKGALTQKAGWLSAVAQGPATFSVAVAGRVKVDTDHGMKVMRLDVPQAGTGTLACDVAMKGASVKVQPGVVVKKEEKEEGVRVTAGLFPQGYVDLRWWEEVKQAGEEKKKEAPRVYAEVNTLLSFGEGLLLGWTAVDYSIVQGGVEELRVKVPDDITLLKVEGEELRDWGVAEGEGGKVLTALLSYKVSGSYSLRVSFEKAMGKTSAAVAVPELQALGVERENGFVGVEARTNIEISTVEVTGATQVDPKELGHPLMQSSPRPVLLGFKYLKHPFDVVVDIKKHVDVPVLVAVVDLVDAQTFLTKEGQSLTKAVFLVRNNMKQFLKVSLPKGSEVWSTYVSGKPVKPGMEDSGRILLPLESSKGGSGDMASFPVEVVYLTKAAPWEKKGWAGVELLGADLPMSRVQWTLYLPQQFAYTKFGGSVEKATMPFTPIEEPQPYLAGERDESLLPTQAVMQSNLANVSFEMTKNADIMQAMDVGVMPVKMKIPDQGKVFRFTKMLVIGEKPYVGFAYRKKLGQQ